MKTLITTYYREPQVDTDKIMKSIFLEKKNYSWSEIFLIPIIGMTVLLGAFCMCLFDLNIDFLSTSISIYSAIGWALFIILNIIIGILVFISKYYPLMILFSAILFLVQNLRIYQLHS